MGVSLRDWSRTKNGSRSNSRFPSPFKIKDQWPVPLIVLTCPLDRSPWSFILSPFFYLGTWKTKYHQLLSAKRIPQQLMYSSSFAFYIFFFLTFINPIQSISQDYWSDEYTIYRMTGSFMSANMVDSSNAVTIYLAISMSHFPNSVFIGKSR